MSCLNPMLAEITSEVNPETGKHKYKFRRSLKNWIIEHPDDESFLREFGKIYKPILHDDNLSFEDSLGCISQINYDADTGEFISAYKLHEMKILPCGQCIGCRTKRAASWADRILLEARYYDDVYFLTLTYDEDNVPLSLSKDGVTSLTLRPKDLQDFIKRLRRDQEYHFGNKIKFYAVGEYGDQFHRPHYHMIAFGLKCLDVREDHRNKSGRMIHTSDRIAKIWNKGIVEVEHLTWELAAYTARYCVKKLGKTESDFYENFGLVPEFQRCSQGFGKAYFNENKEEIYKYDEIYLTLASGGRKVKPPKYYDKLYDDVYPAQMAEIRHNREEIATQALKLKLNRTNLSYLELSQQEEAAFKNRIKSLRRTLE